MQVQQWEEIKQENSAFFFAVPEGGQRFPQGGTCPPSGPTPWLCHWLLSPLICLIFRRMSMHWKHGCLVMLLFTLLSNSYVKTAWGFRINTWSFWQGLLLEDECTLKALLSGKVIVYTFDKRLCQNGMVLQDKYQLAHKGCCSMYCKLPLPPLNQPWGILPHIVPFPNKYISTSL